MAWNVKLAVSTTMMLVASLSAQAEDRPAKPGQTPGEIVVTGRLDTIEEARDQASAFVKGISATPVSGQFARWNTAVCPKTIGLSDEHNQIVTQRVRSIASEAGVRLANEKCRANLLVVFTDDGKAQLDMITRRDARISRTVSPRERQLLAEPDRAARWWYATRAAGKDGHTIGLSSMLATSVIEGPVTPGFISNGSTEYVDGYDSSLIGTRIRVNIEQANIVIDANQANGRSLNAVAGFAALVTLARIRMDSDVDAEDSLIGLFNGTNTAIRDLTPRDKAFLTALYKTDGARESRQHQARIANEMAKLLVTSE